MAVDRSLTASEGQSQRLGWSLAPSWAPTGTSWRRPWAATTVQTSAQHVLTMPEQPRCGADGMDRK
jgi:hypothetical protein